MIYKSLQTPVFWFNALFYRQANNLFNRYRQSIYKIYNRIVYPLLEVFMAWILSCIFYLAFFGPFLIYEIPLSAVLDALCNFMDWLTSFKLLQKLRESSAFTKAHKMDLIVIAFVSQIVLFTPGIFLILKPKGTNTNTGVYSDAAVDETFETIQLNNFLMSYVNFWAVSQFFTEFFLKYAQFFPGDRDLKNIYLKPSKPFSILLFSVDTLWYVYSEKYLPGMFSFRKELFGCHTQVGQHGFVAKFFLTMYFTILAIHILVVALMLNFDCVPSKTFVSEAILSLFFFLFYKYVSIFKEKINEKKAKNIQK